MNRNTIDGFAHLFIILGWGFVDDGLEELGNEIDQEEEEQLSVEGFAVALGVPVVEDGISAKRTGVDSPE